MHEERNYCRGRAKVMMMYVYGVVVWTTDQK
jgi:hypothetical protein